MNLSILEFGQLIGLIASAMSLYALTHSSDSKLLKWFCLSNGLWISHYALISAPMMAQFMTLSLIRSIIAWKHPEWKSVKLGTMALLVTAGGWLCFINNFAFKCIIIYLTMLLISYAVFYLKGTTMRKVFIGCDIAWLGLDITSMSIGGIIYDSVAIYLCFKAIIAPAVDSHQSIKK